MAAINEEEIEQHLEQAQCRYGRMYFFRDDGILGRALREYGEWAQHELDLLMDLVGPDSVVVDIGAFIGTHTLAFAARLHPRGVVYAFEPHPAYFHALERNVAGNGSNNVRLFNVGLSDRRQTMDVVPPTPGGESNPGGTHLQAVKEQGSQFSISVETLDGFDLPRCDLIKIDTEGMERLVLRGADKTIRRLRPLVYAECNSVHEGWPVVELMHSHGYECHLHCASAFNPQNYRCNPENFFGEAREVGLLFVPTDRPGFFTARTGENRMLAPVSSLDDLVLGLLKKPQYKGEVLARTAAARVLGSDFWANEPEASFLRDRISEQADEISELRDALPRAQRLAVERAEVITAINQRLDQTDAALGEAQRLAWQRAEEIDLLSARLAETERALAETQTLTRQRTTEIELLSARLAETDRALAEVRTIALERFNEAQRWRHAYEAVTTSLSWRLTGPLRAVVRSVLRRRRTPSL